LEYNANAIVKPLIDQHVAGSQSNRTDTKNANQKTKHKKPLAAKRRS